MSSKYCSHMRCYVGPHFCRVCQRMGSEETKGCTTPLTLEVLKDATRPESRSERLRKRANAVRVLERELKAAYLFTSAGDAVHSTSKRSKTLPQRISSEVLPRKNESSLIQEAGLNCLNSDISNDLKQSLLDSSDLKRSLI